jgi:hypothetical protein
MLNIQYFFLIYITNKKLNYLLILSLLHGWILIHLFNIIYFSKKTYLFQECYKTILLNSKKIWKILYIYNLGFNLLHKNVLVISGTGYKVTVRSNKFFMRFGFSNKIIVKLLQNIKFFLIKKTFVIMKSRYWNLNKLITYKLKKVSINGVYKKKGIYFKNELIYLKQGKISKN